ncbi:MAG: carboxypeptidase regulatory-like domain-containing protein [Phycisphaeraceae bacterium]|nr:carboxypeptidase regulatory-like domain-containing protein [Phycisphaeraceae bacterium]
MRKLRLPGWGWDSARLIRVAAVIGVLLATVAASGCAKPIPFQVADTDSQLPLEGVRIYRHSVSIFSPLPSRRPPHESDFTGTATVPIPPNPTNLTFLRQGYEPTAVGVFRRMPTAMALRADASSEPDPDAPWQRILLWDDLMPKIEVPVVMRPLRRGMVEVFVVDHSGRPVAGCEVLGSTFLYLPLPGDEPEWGFPPLQRVFTDATGRAVLDSWSGFRNRYTARLANHDDVFVDLNGAQTSSVELRIQPLEWKAQRMRVLDQKRRPISGATVTFGRLRNGLPESPHAFEVTTDADGFTPELRLPSSETLLLQVKARGYKDRLAAPLWRAIDDGGTWRVIMDRK